MTGERYTWDMSEHAGMGAGLGLVVLFGVVLFLHLIFGDDD